MKGLLVALLLTLGLNSSLAAQEHTPRPPAPSTPSSTPTVIDDGGWTRYNSNKGRFTVLMPGFPEDKVETTQSEHGPYTTHLFILRQTNLVFLIGFVDYDPSFNFNKQAELEMNRDNFVKGISATLLHTRQVTIDGYPALEFAAEANGRIFRSRVYMVGRRPYQIVIGSPKGEENTTYIDRFFNSFKIEP